MRIFTTAYEMPFAGHPTLGTAHVARALGLGGDRLGLSMPVGVIPVEADGDSWTLTANPGRVEADLDPDDLAAALQLPPGTVLAPAQQVSVGTSQVMARVADAEAVARASAVPDPLHGVCRDGALRGRGPRLRVGGGRTRAGRRPAP